jgi:hypothetical protein
MPESIEEYYERVKAAADEDGRLATNAESQAWDVFPFESEGLRLKPLEPLAQAEALRHGEGGKPCSACYTPDERHTADLVPRPQNWRADAEVWRDSHWRITVTEPSGSPLILVLAPQDHYDFTTLPTDRAAEMGQIMVALGAAIEALPSTARVHVSKWGDGGAHAHIFFYARPTRMPQLRGTMMAVWDDYLPPVPRGVRDANARAVVQDLVRSYGGVALGATA